MPQGHPLPGPAVNENMPLLPVPHIVPQHLASIAGQLHGSGRTRDVAPCPMVVLAFGFGEGDLASAAVPQLDPGLQDLLGRVVVPPLAEQHRIVTEVPQDPADEPAAVLLERIKAEKARIAKPERNFN
jgi:hypothetical protein